jgi:hypothetical protein
LEHHQRLIGLVRASPVLMEALRAVRALRLGPWCIGAGAIRSLVWDDLHGFAERTPLDDVDVVYFDPSVGAVVHDAALENRLRHAMPSVAWEVTNQATVHHWFASHLGLQVPPLTSLEDGVATWPEIATCVGVFLRDDDSIGVVAPHGLEDLFHLVVRHNPVRADTKTYRERVASKRFVERWPLLSIWPA